MNPSPRDYRCLTCDAKPGSPCMRPSGHAIPFGDFHAGRKAMFDFHYPPVDRETTDAQEVAIPTRAGVIEYEGRLF